LNKVPAYYSLALAPVVKSFRLLPRDFLAHFEEILFLKAVFTLEKFFGKNVCDLALTLCYSVCLSHLGQHDTNRLISIHVILPMVARQVRAA